MPFAENIKQLRKSLGLSQEQLAEMVGVSRQAISKWETNQSSPDIDKIEKLCSIFSVTSDELLGIKVHTQQQSPQKIDIYAKLNYKKRLFTIGWITSLTGVVLLIIEFLFLYVLKAIEKQLFSQFYNNVLSYAKQPPMSFIFIITFVLLFSGIIMSVYNYKK